MKQRVGAYMGSVVDMKQRVATAKATLNASALSERNRGVRIMGLLESVEKNIAHNQQQMSDLKEERNRALDEVQHLRGLLNVMLANTEELQKREQVMGLDEMEKLMDRLSKLASPSSE
jgi:anion-transporting  ArsA/GET3 family ATPase